jgi:hypothetical protein
MAAFICRLKIVEKANICRKLLDKPFQVMVYY